MTLTINGLELDRWLLRTDEEVPVQESEDQHWAAGWNIPGYMPEMDPYISDSWERCRDFLVEDLRRWRPSPEQRDAERVIRELVAAKEDTYNYVVGKWSYWIQHTSEEPEGVE